MKETKSPIGASITHIYHRFKWIANESGVAKKKKMMEKDGAVLSIGAEKLK